MKKDSKQRLFELMGKLDSKFKLNEDINIEGLYLSDDDLNDIFKGYIEAAIWTEEERLKDEVQSYNNTVTNDYDDEDDESEDEIRFMRIMKNSGQRKKFGVLSMVSIESE